VDDWTVEELPERIAEVRQLYLDTLKAWPRKHLPLPELYTRPRGPAKKAPVKKSQAKKTQAKKTPVKKTQAKKAQAGKSADHPPGLGTQERS
jgi:putative phosphoserine phosphatase/1-acylglycerol-3-phosphate O-acyltransferase